MKLTNYLSKQDIKYINSIITSISKQRDISYLEDDLFQEGAIRIFELRQKNLKQVNLRVKYLYLYSYLTKYAKKYLSAYTLPSTMDWTKVGSYIDSRMLDTYDSEGNIVSVIDNVPDFILGNRMISKAELYELMKQTLNGRDFDMLFYRFGLDGAEPLTLRELSNIYGISFQRCDEIIKRAIKKLKKCIDEM